MAPGILLAPHTLQIFRCFGEWKGKVVAEKVEARVEMVPKVEAGMAEKVAVVNQDADGLYVA